MSLVVWLPLNGNLNNQGLSDVTVTVSGTTSYAAGKIGQALSCNGSSYWIISSITLTQTTSICLWIKTTDTNAMPWVLTATGYANTNFWIYNGYYYLNTGDGANNPFQNNGSNVAALTDENWHHYAITFDGTSCLLYIDGVYAGKAKTYKSPVTSNNTIKLAGGFSNAHSYDTLGSLNDFRVYDHCLSDKEVKEISKGLILHYPLNANVLTYSYDSGGMILEDGSQWIKLLHHNAPASNLFTASTGAYPYKNCTSENLYSRLYLLDDAANFLSVDNCYEFIIREKTTSSATENQFRWKQTSNPGTSTSITGFQSIENPTGSARLIGLKKDQSTYAYAHNGSSWWVACGSWTAYNGGIPGVNDTVTTGYLDLYVRVDNIKLKPGDLICDDSGYCNDASIYGNLSIESSDARYLKSIKFTDGRTDYIKSVNTVYFPTDKITISCWVKGAAEAGYGNYDIVFCANSSNFEFSLEGATGKFRNGFIVGGSRSVVTTSFVTRDNSWHFIAATYDGTNIKRYGDGALINTTAASGALSAGPYNVYMGNYSGSTTYGMKNLSVSDVRVYATALSAEDILELYHTAASVDNTGNLFAYQLNEV